MSYREQLVAAAYDASLLGHLVLPQDYLSLPMDGRLAIALPWHKELLAKEAAGDARAVWLLRHFPGMRCSWDQGFVPTPENPSLPSACVIGPVACVGGAERWAETLVAATCDRLNWRGFGVTQASAVHPQTIAAWNDLAPVALGEDQVVSLCRECDIVVAWGIPGLRSLVLPGPILVNVSHSPRECPWGQDLMASNDADAWVAVSEAAKEAIPDHAGRRTAVVIPNGVDEVRVRATDTAKRRRLLARWGVQEGQRVVGMLGRCSAEKDLDAVLRAVAALPGDYVGIVVGETQQSELVARAGRTGGRVRVFPPTSDIATTLAAFDVVLGASIYESFWLVGVEAMLARRPIVSTKVGVLSEVEGLARIIPPKASGKTIARAILADAADAAGTAKRIQRAEKVAMARWSLVAFQEAWGAFLTGLVAAPSRSARPRSGGRSAAGPATTKARSSKRG
jgi:glycosyltransferase involved in cell wall biosynthesis